MSRLEQIFDRCKREERKALVIFASCGCPTMNDSEILIGDAIAAGADIIELGVPFSDPMADGKVIQAASQVALANGADFGKILELAGRLRRKYPETALIIFSYFNVLLSYGLERAAAAMAEQGVDGVLAVDLPLEERGELSGICEAANLSLIPLVSPSTSPERAAQIVAGATGFVYCVTVRGVTGERGELPAELRERLTRLRQLSPVPVLAGFGIADGKSARAAGADADGVVVGSAAVRICNGPDALPEKRKKLGSLVSELAAALKK